MNFINRLKFYAFGVGIGLIFVFFIYKDRKIDAWLPEGRVTEQIQRNEVALSPLAACQMECHDINTEDIKILLTESDVDFEKSDPRKKPCPIYHITLNPKSDKALKILIESCSEKATIQEILTLANGCNCDFSSN